MKDRYTILHTHGETGPSWACDDRAEALALADEHGYIIEDVIIDQVSGYYLVVQPELKEWDSFPSQLELVAAMIYNARAQSTREMTPERWARIKLQFRGSARMCLEQAKVELEDM